MTRRQKVDEAVRRIREFWTLGRGLPLQERKRVYGEKINDTAAAQTGMNADTVGKARKFADPVLGYTYAEMNELCRLVKDVQTKQPDKDERGKSLHVFGRTHVVRMVSVPKRLRPDLQNEAIRKGWSLKELERRISSMFLVHEDRGRRRHVPDDVVGKLAQVREMCVTWVRWAEAIDKQRREAGKKGPRPAAIPKHLRDRIEKATSELRSVLVSVNFELFHEHGRTLRRAAVDRWYEEGDEDDFGDDE